MQTIASVQRLLTHDGATCLDVARRCIEAIAELEPRLHAWAYTAPERLQEDARHLDELRSQGVPCGPLFGVPVGVKDIIDVAGMPTACGFPPWKERWAHRNATLVDRILSAGGMIPGKTVTTQFAAFDPPDTANPWDTSRTPGGSSSGSAVVVATGTCPVAIGTQTGGSVLRPAAYCGVVGLKPTFGTISRRGVFPLSPTLDHVGVFATNVDDALTLFQVVAGPDPGDPAEGKTVHFPAPSHGARTVPRLRIGVLEAFYRERTETDAWAAVEKAIGWLEAAGGIVEPVDSLDEKAFTEILEHHRAIMCAEAAFVHRNLYGQHPEDYAPAIASLVEQGLKLAAFSYQTALAVRTRYRQQLKILFQRHDVLVMPTTPSTAPERSTTGDPAFQSPWSFLGAPALSVPVHLGADGLPLSVQLVSDLHREDLLALAGKLIEKERGPFPSPRFLRACKEPHMTDDPLARLVRRTPFTPYQHRFIAPRDNN